MNGFILRFTRSARQSSATYSLHAIHTDQHSIFSNLTTDLIPKMLLISAHFITYLLFSLFFLRLFHFFIPKLIKDVLLSPLALLTVYDFDLPSLPSSPFLSQTPKSFTEQISAFSTSPISISFSSWLQLQKRGGWVAGWMGDFCFVF